MLAKLKNRRKSATRPSSARSLTYGQPQTALLSTGIASTTSSFHPVTNVDVPHELVTEAAAEVTIDQDDSSDSDDDAYWHGEDDEKYEYPSSNDDSDDEYSLEPEDDIATNSTTAACN